MSRNALWSSLFLTVALLAPSARATEIKTFSARGQSAAADFFTTSSCIETIVSLQGALVVTNSSDVGVEDIARGNRTVVKTVTPFVSILISIWDDCQKAVLLSAGGDATTETLNIDPNLGHATLVATGVPLYNATTGGTIYADIDMTWDAVGHSPRATYNSVVAGHGATVSVHASGKINDAVASGTVRLHGVVGYGDESTNHTTGQSVGGFIEKDSNLQVTVTRDESTATPSARLIRAGESLVGANQSPLATWGRLRTIYR